MMLAVLPAEVTRVLDMAFLSNQRSNQNVGSRRCDTGLPDPASLPQETSGSSGEWSS